MVSLRQPQHFDDGVAQLLDGTSSGLIFKHSPYCSLSTHALQQVCAFAVAHPEVPIVLIDVIRQRDLSNRIAAQLGLPHASPQAVLMESGRRVWNASHRGVNTPALEQAVGRGAGAPS